MVLRSGAQELLPGNYDTIVHGPQIKISGNGFYHSNALHNELITAFYRGEQLTTELIANSAYLGPIAGRFGSDFVTTLEFQNGKALPFKTKTIGWMMAFGTAGSAGTIYSKDAYDLIFDGNEGFLGKQASLGNSAFYLIDYHKLGFGLVNQTNKNFIRLNLVLVNNFLAGRMDRCLLDFSADGSTIAIDTDVTFQQANVAPQFKGIGASLDFQLTAPIIDMPGISGFFQITARNIGLVHLTNMDEFRLRSQGVFDGWTISELADISNYNEGDVAYLKDSLGFTQSSSNVLKVIPNGFIQAGKIVETNTEKRFQSFFGIRMRTNEIYRPLFYLGGDMKLTNQLSSGIQLSCFGYGGLRGGWYINGSFNKISLGIGTEDLIGLISKNLFGKSALIQLNWKL